MPTHLRKLKTFALDICKKRKHKMSHFVTEPLNQVHGSKIYCTAICSLCHKTVTVTENPTMFNREIEGGAVMYNCVEIAENANRN